MTIFVNGLTLFLMVGMFLLSIFDNISNIVVTSVSPDSS